MNGGAPSSWLHAFHAAAHPPQARATRTSWTPRATPHSTPGTTHLRRVFDLADLYGVRTGSHGAGDPSPVSFTAARYPYERRYPPVNRRLDGSMHDW